MKFKQVTSQGIPQKTKSITTAEIECAVARIFNTRKNIIIPNISFGLDGMHECDIFLIKNSGLAVEIEIKISVSDMKADAKKSHGHIDKKNRICELYYALPKSILDKCLGLIPPHAGIITCEKHESYDRVLARIHRSPVKIKGARKLTIDEQMKVMRLGVMRIFPLKEKVIMLQKTIKGH